MRLAGEAGLIELVAQLVSVGCLRPAPGDRARGGAFQNAPAGGVPRGPGGVRAGRGGLRGVPAGLPGGPPAGRVSGGVPGHEGMHAGGDAAFLEGLTAGGSAWTKRARSVPPSPNLPHWGVRESALVGAARAGAPALSSGAGRASREKHSIHLNISRRCMVSLILRIHLTPTHPRRRTEWRGVAGTLWAPRRPPPCRRPARSRCTGCGPPRLRSTGPAWARRR